MPTYLELLQRQRKTRARRTSTPPPPRAGAYSYWRAQQRQATPPAGTVAAQPPPPPDRRGAYSYWRAQAALPPGHAVAREGQAPPRATPTPIAPGRRPGVAPTPTPERPPKAEPAPAPSPTTPPPPSPPTTRGDRAGPSPYTTPEWGGPPAPSQPQVRQELESFLQKMETWYPIKRQYKGLAAMTPEQEAALNWDRARYWWETWAYPRYGNIWPPLRQWGMYQHPPSWISPEILKEWASDWWMRQQELRRPQRRPQQPGIRGT